MGQSRPLSFVLSGPKGTEGNGTWVPTACGQATGRLTLAPSLPGHPQMWTSVRTVSRTVTSGACCARTSSAPSPASAPQACGLSLAPGRAPPGETSQSRRMWQEGSVQGEGRLACGAPASPPASSLPPQMRTNATRSPACVPTAAASIPRAASSVTATGASSPAPLALSATVSVATHDVYSSPRPTPAPAPSQPCPCLGLELQASPLESPPASSSSPSPGSSLSCPLPWMSSICSVPAVCLSGPLPLTPPP